MPSQPFAAPRPAEPFVVGDWTVHPDRNLLVRGADERRLEARTMNVLVHLAACTGRVVSKDDLIDAVWEGRIIAEGTLTNTVAGLRAALGDDVRRPRYIETIPKRGYRLVAAIEDAVVEENEHPTAAPRWSRRRLAVIVAAAVLAAAAVAAVAVVRARTQGLDPERVLVLPLANRTGDSAVDPLALMARDRMVQVAVDAGLGHMAPGAAPAATQEEAMRMGWSARAAVVVTGSIYLRDGELEIEPQLVDVTAGELLYATPPVVVPEGGSAAAVAELSDRTLGALATHLRAHAHARLLSHAPPFAAYREFMAGSELFGTNYEKAFVHLRRAVGIDPGYTSAWIRLAVGYGNVGRIEEASSIFNRLEARRQELTPFERLSLDFVSRLNVSPSQAYSSLRELDRIAPRDPMFTYMGGGLALALNRPREALRWIGVAPREIPLFLGRSVMMANEHSVRAAALHILGDYAGELTAAREGVRRYPGVMDLRSAEARALASLGDRSGVEAVIAEALAIPPQQGSVGWVILQAAAAARAHGHPALAAELAARAAAWFERSGESYRGVETGRAESLFHVGGAGLAHARSILEHDVAGLQADAGGIAVEARGWLGAVAARQGDVQRASELDSWLEAVGDPRLRDDALFYRAATAAWQGDREAAASLFREALAAGWGRFGALHDVERILLEPVAGDPYFAAVLHPER